MRPMGNLLHIPTTHDRTGAEDNNNRDSVVGRSLNVGSPFERTEVVWLVEYEEYGVVTVVL